MNEEQAKKATQMREYELRQEEICEGLDGADLLTIIFVLCEDSSESPLEFLESRQMRHIIHGTQSNPEKSYAILKEFLELDEKIGELDE